MGVILFGYKLKMLLKGMNYETTRLCRKEYLMSDTEYGAGI